jgi:hypothetical protein
MYEPWGLRFRLKLAGFFIAFLVCITGLAGAFTLLNSPSTYDVWFGVGSVFAMILLGAYIIEWTFRLCIGEYLRVNNLKKDKEKIDGEDS